MADARFKAELVDGVSPGAKSASTALERLQKKIKSFNDSGIGKAVSKMQEWGKNAIIVGVAATAAVGAAISHLAVETVDFTQRSRMAFGLLAKAGEVPEQLFQRSIALAQDLGLDVQDTTKQIQKFRALQFTQSGAEDMIKMGADMQAIGASAEEVTRIFAQLGQIQAKGKLQGEELVVLAENGLSTQLVYESLEKQFHKTRSEILKMQQAGAIDSTSALKAIGEAILHKTGTTQFGQAGKKAAEATMEGMLRRFKSMAQGGMVKLADMIGPKVMDSFKSILATFSGFGGSDLLGRLATLLMNVADAAEKAAPIVKVFLEAFANAVIASTTESMGNLADTLGQIDLERVAIWGERAGTAIGMVIDLLTRFADLLDFVNTPAGDFIAKLAGVVFVAAKVYTWGVTLVGWVISFGAALIDGIAAVASFLAGIVSWPVVLAAAAVAAVVAIYVFRDEIATFFSGLWESFKQWGADLMTGLVQGIIENSYAVVDAIMGVASSAAEKFKSFFGIHSPSTLMAEYGVNIGEGLEQGLQSVPSAQQMAAQLGAAPRPGASGSGQNITYAPTIHVQAMPGATREDGQRLGEGIMDTIRRGFGSMLEDAAIERGELGVAAA